MNSKELSYNIVSKHTWRSPAPVSHIATKRSFKQQSGSQQTMRM